MANTQITPLPGAEQSKSIKANKSKYTFKLAIRDRPHFYKIVNWLNENVGKGTDFWTMEGRILKKLKSGQTTDTAVYIFIDDFDASSALYLSFI